MSNKALVEFDADASEAFKDLVAQTLEESDFIETEWSNEHAYRSDDELIIREV